MIIDIRGLDKADLFARLYNAARPVGMGFLHYDPAKMTSEEAKRVLAFSPYIDYYKGRPIKMSFASDEVDTALYDRDQGDGLGESIIEELRAESES